MKKYLIIIGSLVAGALIIWAILWNAGREEIVDRMDREIKALAQMGTEVEYQERIIGGFPFGYSVTLKEVIVEIPSAQSTYFLPKIVTSADISDLDRLTTVLPDKIKLEVLPPEDPTDRDGELPDPVNIDFETINAQVVVDGLPSSRRSVITTADSLLLVFSDADTGSHIAVEFQGLESTAKLPLQIGGQPVTSTGTIDLLDFVVKGVAETGAAVTVEGQIDNITMAGSSDLRSADDFEAMMDGTLSGKISGAFTSGKSVTHMASAGTAETTGGDLRITGGTSSTNFSLEDGSLVLNAEHRNSSWEMESQGEGPLTNAKLNADLFEVIYQVPFAPSEEMKPFETKLAIIGLTLDEALWDALDKEKTLERSPAELLFDANGTMRLTKPQSEVRSGEAPPVAFGTLSINRADAAALGAYVKATGDIEFIQPINLPNGAVTVRAKGVIEAMTSLVDTGVLTPDILLITSLMAQNYLRVDPATNEMIGQVEMGVGGITINGKPLQ